MNVNKLKILAIDDQRDNLTTIKALLTDALPGCQLLTALDGPSGLALARKDDPDAILLDIIMPDMDGFEVCRRLKAEERVRDIPVIFLTALGTDRATRLKAIDAGGEAFSAKPPDEQELVTQLRAMAKLKAASRMRRLERDELAALVAERTQELEQELAERQRLTGELRDRELLYRSVVRNSPALTVLMDQDGVVTYVSPQCERVLGHLGDKFVGQAFPDIIHPDDIAKYQEAWTQMVKGGQDIANFEYRIFSAQGELRWISHSATQVRAEDKVLSIQSTLTDITERQQAATRLQESEDRFRTLFENAPLGYQSLDEEGRFLEVNQAWLDTLGYERAEVVGRNFAEFLTPEGADTFHEKFPLFMAAGEISCVILVRDKQGEARTIAFAGRIGRHANGAFKQTHCILTDITERRRAEDALRESHQKAAFQAELLWNAPVIAAFHDKELNLVWANRAYELATGQSAQEMVGKKCYSVWGLTGPCRGCPVVEAIATGQTCAAELTPQNQDHWPESQGHWLSQAAPVRDEQGNIIGAIETATNITEQKQMQAQLAQSDRLASMGMLAAGVAHEINNPLSYVLYNLESLTEDLPRLAVALNRCLSLLAGQLGNDELSTSLGAELELLNPSMLDDILARFKDALQGTQRIKDVARGLGTFSRVDDKRLAPVNLMQVIEVAINMVFNEIKYRARLVKEYGQTSSIMASDGRLSQVFLNLLINAAHALDDGDLDSHEIRVRTWQEGGEVFAEVRDNGKGISEKDLAHIFEPFYTTKAIGVGTGLGLSISQSIIEGYGGRIEVKSEVGKGTSFVVRLPIEHQAEATDAAQTKETTAEAMVSGRILIIDDEDAIRSAMVRMLKGHDVVEAASGAEARQILEVDQSFELILCDMMMPTVSGVDLHGWLSTINPALAKQVVFMTGGAFTPRARDYLAEVSNLRLEKPFDVANFKKIVNELVRGAKQHRRNNTSPPNPSN